MQLCGTQNSLSETLIAQVTAVILGCLRSKDLGTIGACSLSWRQAVGDSFAQNAYGIRFVLSLSFDIKQKAIIITNKIARDVTNYDSLGLLYHRN